MGSSPDRVKPTTVRLVFVASPLIMQHEGEDWLARNEDNVSEWCDMSTRGLLFQ